MTRYDIDDFDVKALAAMAGVKPGNGMVNTLNAMAERGLIGDGTKTVRELYRAWLRHLLDDEVAAMLDEASDVDELNAAETLCDLLNRAEIAERRRAEALERMVQGWTSVAPDTLEIGAIGEPGEVPARERTA